MLGTVGATLSQAVGIAASPLPIIAVIFLLMAPSARVRGVLFMLGWVVGTLGVTTVFSFATRLAVGTDPDAGAQPILGWSKIALGVLLLLLAVRQWRRRPAPGTRPEPPAWMPGSTAWARDPPSRSRWASPWRIRRTSSWP